MQYCARIETTVASPCVLAPCGRPCHTPPQNVRECQSGRIRHSARGKHVRALHDHLGRLPRRAAVRGVPAVPRRQVPPRSSTSSWPSAHAQSRAKQMKLNYDYITHWETEQRGRPPRRVRRRAARQGDGRRRRRGRGDLRRRRRDHRHGVAAVRRRPVGRRRSRIPSSRSPAPARTTGSSSSCAATRPSGAAGIGLVPICHDVERARRRDRVARRQARHPRDHDPDDVARPHAVQRPVLRPGVGRVPRPRGFPVHTHSGEAPREEMDDYIGIYLAEVVWWTAPADRRTCCSSGAFERHPGLKFVVTEGAAYWAADMKWKWDQYFGGGHTTKKMAAADEGQDLEAAVRVLRRRTSSSARRRCRRRRSGAATSIGCDVVMWGTDYPHPEGTWPNTVGVLQATSATCRSATPASCSARPRRAATASTSTALRADRRAHRPDARGPRPGPVAARRSRRGRQRALVEGRVRRQGDMTLAPFRIEIPDERLALLRDRLRTTVWADEPNAAPTTGRSACPGAYLRELVAYWIDEYDWRAQEAAMNRFPHVRGEIDGVTVHAIHERGSGPAPDPARAHARMAVDVLGLRQGDRAARAPGALRRRPGRRVRRDRAVAARVRSSRRPCRRASGGARPQASGCG